MQETHDYQLALSNSKNKCDDEELEYHLDHLDDNLKGPDLELRILMFLNFSPYNPCDSPRYYNKKVE